MYGFADPKTLLLSINQLKVFEFAFGHEIDTSILHRNPFRKDLRPTCSFFYHNGILYMRDFGINKNYNPFEILRMVGYDFKNAINFILFNFELAEVPKKASTPKKIKYFIPVISCINEQDLDYLKSFSISKKTTKRYNVFSVSELYKNGDLIYKRTKDNPCIAYYLGLHDNIPVWQFYFYQNDKLRFITNKTKLLGYNQLPSNAKELIITKSMKDVMVFSELGYNSVAPMGESTNIIDIEELKERFDIIYCMYDFDYAGIVGANKLKKQGIIPMFLTNGRFKTVDYKAKDISDYVRNNNLRTANEVITNFRNTKLSTSFKIVP